MIRLDAVELSQFVGLGHKTQDARSIVWNDFLCVNKQLLQQRIAVSNALETYPVLART